MTFLFVSQHNHREVTSRYPSGCPKEVDVLHKKPDNFNEALELMREKPLHYDVFYEPWSWEGAFPIRWGYITYKVQKDGSLTYVGDDADTSDCSGRGGI